MLNSRKFNESVAVLRAATDSSITVTPLGIYTLNEGIYVDIFPGTSIYERADSFYEACILFPFTIEPFYKALGIGGENIELRAPRYISTPCPNYNGIVIEAVVESRQRKGEKIRLRINPIASYVLGEPRPYSRDYGCSIELLIALTRIKYWARAQRPIPCRSIEELSRIIVSSFNCILHATWSEELHRLAALAASQAYKWLSLTGCA